MATKHDDDPQLMTPAEVASLCRTSLGWVYKKAADGTLPVTQCGKYLRFARLDVLRWLAGQRREGPR